MNDLFQPTGARTALVSSKNDLLKSVSRSFYLSMRFLPAAMREPVSLGYLLARLTDTLADAPGLPQEDRLALLEEVRLVMAGRHSQVGGGLRKLSGTIEHPGERHLLRAGDELFEWYRELPEPLRELLSEVILTIIQGQSWDLQAFRADEHAACATREDLLRYTYWVAGSVGEFWTRVGFATLGEKFAAAERAPDMLVSGARLGQALQLVNILRDLHEDLPQGRCYLPKDELLAVGWDGSTALTATELSPVFHKWLGVTHGFLGETDSYLRELRDARVRFCTRLPKLLAEETVSLLRTAGIHQVMREKISISRGDVWRAMGRAIFF